jgi:superfamily II RNA helicase
MSAAAAASPAPAPAPVFLSVPSITTPPPATEYPPTDPAISYTFPLDIWQQHAVAAIHRGDNVLVTAKTGSGKTLVGEYQIAHSLRAGKRVFYTTPIKSLSNQKYHDLKKLFPAASVGIMTGDIKSAPEADIVVMTTEILRNLLFKQSTSTASVGTAGALSLERLDAVVFDEVHYINDPDRGHVWEETLILLPPSVHLVLLSATIDSPEAFAGWLGRAKGKPIVLLKTSHRIVPLVHGVWDPSTPRGSLPLAALKKGDEAPYDGGAYTGWLRGREAHVKAAEDWSARVAAATARGDSVAGAEGKTRVHAFTHVLNQAVSTLQERDLLPALFFVFSRAECERYADAVAGSLLDSSDTAAVKHILRFHLHRYDETLLHLPQYHQVVRLLERGIAFHHSGLLPLLKEVVEILFAKGYVRALFCTETFAVGLNMPARTVVFLDLKKPHGGAEGGFRPLRADEYIQMAGRAGRRGKDTQGVVIYLPARRPLEPEEMRAVLTGPLQPLESRLQFHYDFLLKAIHASAAAATAAGSAAAAAATAATPLWNAVIDASYWSAQRAAYAEAVEKDIAALAAERAAIPLTDAECAEISVKRTLEARVRATVNAEKRRAQAELEAWKNKHMGVKWVNAEKLMDVAAKLDDRITRATAILESFRAPVEPARVLPLLEALGEWGALKENGDAPPSLTPFGVLATEVNEGNPLIMARLFEAQVLKDATPDEIVGVLGSLIVEREALDKSLHPRSLPAPVTPRVVETLLLMDEWCSQGVAIDARYSVGSPEEYWSLSTLWVQIGMEWYAGASAADLCTRYEMFAGNLMRGLLKLANLVNEWISLATFTADVDMLERLKEAPARLLRDIAVPESLYLRL